MIFMSSIFYGLEIAKSGLYSSQKGLELTGHNVSNASTKGYTRQVLNLKSVSANNRISFNDTKFEVGMGVDVVNIEQIRDNFLDMQYRQELSRQGEYQIKADNLNFIELIFNEPSDTGLTTVINNFFEAFQELSKNPESLTNRALVDRKSTRLNSSHRT